MKTEKEEKKLIVLLGDAVLTSPDLDSLKVVFEDCNNKFGFKGVFEVRKFTSIKEFWRFFETHPQVKPFWVWVGIDIGKETRRYIGGGEAIIKGPVEGIFIAEQLKSIFPEAELTLLAFNAVGSISKAVG